MYEKNLIRALNKKSNISVPIWLMRQAGRYLPEYMSVRNKAGNFLDLCYSPKLAAEVTIQPIERFDFDAAIIFSDILTIPHSMGIDVNFDGSHGPKLRKISNSEELKDIKENIDKLNFVYEAISITRSRLHESKSLIGFAGAPWTVATYILEGGGSKDFFLSKKAAYNDKSFIRDLIDNIKYRTIDHLNEQIKAGVNVIQIFDSWSGVLCYDEYKEFVINPTKDIVSAIKKIHKDVPVIGFPKGSGFLYDEYIKSTNIDCVSVDHSVPVEMMTRFQSSVAVQGNLDPVVLFSKREIIKNKVHNILDKMSLGDGFIFNLGHGILPQTPIDNVEFLVKCVREYKMQSM